MGFPFGCGTFFGGVKALFVNAADQTQRQLKKVGLGSALCNLWLLIRDFSLNARAYLLLNPSVELLRRQIFNLFEMYIDARLFGNHGNVWTYVLGIFDTTESEKEV